MLASLKVIYSTVCVIECVLVKKNNKSDKCHLICDANYRSITTWTTPLMTVNDRVVMRRCELAVSQLNPSLLPIMAPLLWSLSGNFRLLKANVNLISYEEKQRA